MPAPAVPVPAPRTRRAWIGPALVGAVVGALVSGSIVAGLTLRDSDERSTPTAASPVPATSTLAPAPLIPPADIHALLDRVEPAVVSVSVSGFVQDDLTSVTPREGAGTGVVLTPDGDVLTNAHVIANASAIKVKLPTGDKTYDAV